jgi:hypothetical protein
MDRPVRVHSAIERPLSAPWLYLRFWPIADFSDRPFSTLSAGRVLEKRTFADFSLRPKEPVNGSPRRRAYLYVWSLLRRIFR